MTSPQSPDDEVQHLSDEQEAERLFGGQEVDSLFEDQQVRSVLAGRLLDAVMAWARDLGAERVHLWVTEGNSPAIALYERFGFAFTGESAPVRSDSALKELKMVLPSTLPRE
jgi:GNAT superfamily N-acetyltransferase